MRKSDLELLEVRLEPLQAARDRLTTDLGDTRRLTEDLRERVKDLERNEEVHKTEIAQGLASIRSLLQRANRAARDVGIIEEEEVVEELPGVNIARSRDDIIRDARQRHVRGNLL